MSNVWPNGCIPASGTEPPVWTETGSQPTFVQYNNVAYEKTDRYSMVPGGTTRGKPNAEEYNGVRTWRPVPDSQPNGGYRYYWIHSHDTIRQYAAYSPDNAFPSVVEEQPVFQETKEDYFRFSESTGGITETTPVSANLFSNSALPLSRRIVAERQYPIGIVGDRTPTGTFDIWVDYLPIIYPPDQPRGFIGPITGWAGPPPDYDPAIYGPWPPPPDPPGISMTLNQVVYATYAAAVGLTYTGYLEVLEANGIWVPIPDTSPVQYTYQINFPVTVSQIAISYTITKQDYINFIDGQPLPTNNITREITGGMNQFKSFGRVVLTSVSGFPA